MNDKDLFFELNDIQPIDIAIAKNNQCLNVKIRRIFTIVFKKGLVKIIKNNVTFAVGKRTDKLYELEFKVLKPLDSYTVNTNESLDLWHKRFGHLHKSSLLETFNKHLVDDLPAVYGNNLKFCETCVQAKMYRLPLNPRSLAPKKFR